MRRFPIRRDSIQTICGKGRSLSPLVSKSQGYGRRFQVGVVTIVFHEYLYHGEARALLPGEAARSAGVRKRMMVSALLEIHCGEGLGSCFLYVYVLIILSDMVANVESLLFEVPPYWKSSCC